MFDCLVSCLTSGLILVQTVCQGYQQTTLVELFFFQIETQKLAFKETAKARTDTGHASGAEKKRSATSSRSDSIASEGSAGTQ